MEERRRRNGRYTLAVEVVRSADTGMAVCYRDCIDMVVERREEEWDRIQRWNLRPPSEVDAKNDG